MTDYIYVDFCIDTGSPVTTITRDVYLALGLTEVCEIEIPLLSTSHSSLAPFSLLFPSLSHCINVKLRQEPTWPLFVDTKKVSVQPSSYHYENMCLLGASFLSDKKLTIDYVNEKIDLNS